MCGWNIADTAFNTRQSLMYKLQYTVYLVWCVNGIIIFEQIDPYSYYITACGVILSWIKTYPSDEATKPKPCYILQKLHDKHPSLLKVISAEQRH